jgi:hypothetical protein
MKDLENPKNTDSGVRKARKRQFFEKKLRSRGLILETEVSNGTTYYVKIHAPFTHLCRKAEYVKLRKPLKASVQLSASSNC